MVCDGQQSKVDRRRNLLQQLKCLVTSMERRNPCEWDNEIQPQPVCCIKLPPLDKSSCIPLQRSNSYEFRGSRMFKCNCIKRNGLQDRCLIWDCMGRPECVTKLYPMCCPGQRALIKLTDFGDEDLALKKYYRADENRTKALEHYCKLKCDDQSAYSLSPIRPSSNPQLCPPVPTCPVQRPATYFLTCPPLPLTYPQCPPQCPPPLVCPPSILKYNQYLTCPTKKSSYSKTPKQSDYSCPSQGPPSNFPQFYFMLCPEYPLPICVRS